MIVLLAAALASAAPTETGVAQNASAPAAVDASQAAQGQPAPAGVAGARAPDAAPDAAMAAPPPVAAEAAPVVSSQAAASEPAATPAPATPARPQTTTGAPIVVEGRTKAPPGDPVIKLNMASYSVAQSVDHAIIEPAAMGYKKHVPSPIRAAVRHFFANLTEPVIAVNFLLQLHPGKAAETVGRFGINSTIGIGGLLDVAKTRTFKLPYRVNGFGYTFAYYGVKPGPFLFIPLVGPTTLRDAIGLGLDRMVLPLVVGGPLRSPYYVASSFVVRSLNDRLAADEGIREARASSDPYTSTKNAYLAQRQAEIDELKGHKHKVAPPAEPVPAGPVSGEPAAVAPSEGPVAPAAPAQPAAPTTPPVSTPAPGQAPAANPIP